MVKERSGMTKELKVEKDEQREKSMERDDRMIENGEGANFLERMPAALWRKRRAP